VLPGTDVIQQAAGKAFLLLRPRHLYEAALHGE
jgi:hypothetical protein